MKTKHFLLVMITIFAASCGNKSTKSVTLTMDETVLKNVEDFVKPKMNDPESYEFVGLELIDSVLYSDNIDYRRRDFTRNLIGAQEDIVRLNEYRLSFPSLYKEEDFQKAVADSIKAANILHGIDSIELELGEKAKGVASYTYLYSFRGNNAFGAKVLHEYIVQTGGRPSLEVLNVAEDRDKVYLTPNGIPGYKEMVSKYWK